MFDSITYASDDINTLIDSIGPIFCYINCTLESFVTTCRIKCTPQEMFDDPNLEKDYIFEQLEKKEKQENIKDLHLHEGSYVRYIMPRANGKKKRY